MMIEDFKIRMYTKKELALMYFPESQPRTAVNHLDSPLRPSMGETPEDGVLQDEQIVFT